MTVPAIRATALPLLVAGLVSLLASPAFGQRQYAPPTGSSGAVAPFAPKAVPNIGLGVTSVQDVVTALDREPAQRVTPSRQSWRTIFDAYLDMTAPPMTIGESFNVDSVHPGMARWSEVAAWAKANEGMAKALHAARDAIGFSLPYDSALVDEKYRARGLQARIGIDDDLRRIELPYIQAIDTIAVYAIAEMYRLLEEGKPAEAFTVATDAARQLRLLADRVLLAEKSHFFALLSDSLAAHRDAIWTYRDRIPVEVLTYIGTDEYPFLAPGRARLEMPEGEKIVAEALIRRLFDERGQPDVEVFADVLGSLQAREQPLTSFGAVRRWRELANVHGSLESSLQRLVNVYDDWWRRWRMRQYDPIIELPTELSRTNPVRYGAVVWSIRDIESLFEQRKRLVAEVNGTAMAAGLAAYAKSFGTPPDDREKAYAMFMRKSSDFDPWDKSYGRFLYRFLGSQRKAVDTPNGRIWVDGGVLYARGRDHEDNDFDEHTPDGSFGEMILWPPVRALEREQGVRD